MPGPGRPTVQIELTAEERETLQWWARRHSSSQALALRCRIVLACAQGRSNIAIAEELGVNKVTVSKWRRRFAADRLEGLVDAPRPGAVRKIGDDVVEAIVVETLETTPKDATHWSTRALAERHGISRQTVSEIWRAFGLKPWRQDEFHARRAPTQVRGDGRAADVQGLPGPGPDREDPRLGRPVPVPAGRSGGVRGGREAADPGPQPVRPDAADAAHHPQRATHDYERNGTLDLFAALEIATGKVITDLRKSHTAADFIAFLNKVNREVPAELDVHVILDNLSTHKTPAVHAWLLRHKGFHFHFTPTYGSWMNFVERWFSALTTKKLQRSAHRSVKALAADIRDWVEHWNENPKPFTWHKTAEVILDRLAGYCTAINK